MYFRLNPECYFIKGKQHGAIYDLIEGDVYALDSKESQKIEECENNEIIDSADPFLLELKKRVVGNFYDKKVFIEKLRLGSPIADYQQGVPPNLARAFLEMGNSCDQSCGYCGYNGVSRSMGCLGCNIWDENGTPVSMDRWKELIDELHLLHCQSLFIKGGNLTKNWEKTREILEYTDKKFKNIFVITHKAHFSEEVRDSLKNKANLIIQIDSLSDIDAQYEYLLMTDCQNANDIFENLPNNVIVDIISRNFNSPQLGSRVSPNRNINKTNLEWFTHNNKLHPCLGNSITISWSGEVLPCPMMRKYSLGNIKERKLWTFLRGTPDSIQEYWNLSLNKLQKCKNCEFRYACTDCRALEVAMTGDLYSKTLCNYDPSRGTWQQADS
jgi:radical SAM protein with 4Fe4S-binding SPASM domain